MSDLEKRVESLEKELARMKQAKLADQTTPWWERISGSFQGNAEYREAMRLGAEYRESLRPSDTDE